MDEERVEQLGHTPILPLLERVDALTDVSELGEFLGFFERRGGGGLFGSYIDSDDRNSERYIVNVVQGGIGLPDESYYREEKFAEIREKYVAYLEPHPHPGRATRPRRHRGPGAGAGDPASPRATGSAPTPATSSRPTTSPRSTSSRPTLPSFDFDAWVTALGGSDETIAETGGAAAVVPRRTSRRCCRTPRSRTGRPS